MGRYLLRNGRLLDPSQSLDRRGDLRLREGRIAESATRSRPTQARR
jgi:dihydroorotase-like cyclic amidohydrolase